MASSQARAFIDEIRTLGFAGISGAYAFVGSAIDYPARIVCFSNNTQGDLLFTDDVTKDKVFVKSGSFKLFDVQSNINPQFDDKYVLPVGTRFSVKQITAPISGSVYIEVLY